MGTHTNLSTQHTELAWLLFLVILSNITERHDITVWKRKSRALIWYAGDLISTTRTNFIDKGPSKLCAILCFKQRQRRRRPWLMAPFDASPQGRWPHRPPLSIAPWWRVMPAVIGQQSGRSTPPLQPLLQRNARRRRNRAAVARRGTMIWDSDY